MHKPELISIVAKKMNCTKKDATAVVNAVFVVIEEALAKGERISVTGFGTFELRERDEKICTNPKTKEKMVCPACRVPAFKAGRDLKRSINN